MDIEIAGRHVTVTQAMKDYARQKAERLARHYDRFVRLHVTLSVENDQQTAEFVASAARHAVLVAKEKSTDMYAAIDVAADKLDRQARKFKEKLRDHRGPQKEEVMEAEATARERAERGPSGDEDQEEIEEE